jgi:hypothetical protein
VARACHVNELKFILSQKGANMKNVDYKKARRAFDEKYTADYPPPVANQTTENKQPSVLLWAWGIVSIAGAIISFPHTMKAISQSVPEITGVLSFGYAGAVFIGVELALLIVAFTEAYRNLENPRPRPVLTLRTVIASILYRMGLAGKPSPETTNDTNMTGLLMALVLSAILFNLADTTKLTELDSIIKVVSGLLAPMLLFLAGHEFANQIATRMLTQTLAQRRADERLAEWQAQRDSAWREHSATLTDTPKSKGQGDDVTVPLADSAQMNTGNILHDLGQGDLLSITHHKNGQKPAGLQNGHGGNEVKSYLMEANTK